MPQVPGTQGEQIQSQGISGPQQSLTPPVALTDDNQVFRSSGNLYSEADQMFQKQKEHADTLAALDAKNQLSNAETQILYDPEDGALLKKGKDAVQVPGIVADKYSQSYNEIRDSLQNDSQKLAFDEYYKQNSANLNRTVQTHVGEELHKFDNETTVAVVSNERGIAVTNYQNPDLIQQSITNQNDEIKKWAARNGVPDDSPILTDKIRDATSKTQAEVISRMLDNNQDLQAQNYYSQVKGQLSGDEIGKIEKQLQVGSLKGSSQRKADEITNVNESYQDALEDVKDIQDPKLRDATQERVKNYFDAQKQASLYDREQTLQQATNDIVTSNGQKDIPTSVLATLEPKQIESLNELRKQTISGVQPQADGPAFYKFQTMASTADTRSTFENTDLTSELVGKVTTTELHGLIEMQSKMRERDGATTDLLDYMDNNNKIKRDVLTKAGIAPGSTGIFSFGSSDSKPFIQINSVIDQDVAQKEKALGRQLTSDEMTDVVNRFATKVVTNPGFLGLGNLFGGSSKFVGNVAPEDIQLSDIPIDVRNNLTNALQSKNWPVNEKNIKDFYIKGLKAGVIKTNGNQ